MPADGPLGELAGDLHARLSDPLRENSLDMRRLAFGRSSKRSACVLDAARRLLGELRGVLTKERVVMLESHNDAPERIVVLEAQGISQSIEPLAFLL